jgi:hypothetical protein
MPHIRYSRKHRKSKHRRFRGGNEPGQSRSWNEWMSGLLPWSKKTDTPSSNPQQYQPPPQQYQPPPQQYQEQYQPPPQQYQEQYQEPPQQYQQQQYPPQQGGRHNRRHRLARTFRKKSRKVSKTRHVK